MKLSVEREMEKKTFSFFCRAPSFSDESIDIRTDHRAGVVEIKERVKADFLKFPQAPASSSSAFMSFMGDERGDPAGIPRVLITL